MGMRHSLSPVVLPAVTLTARNVEKGEGVAESIRNSTGNPNLDVRELELLSPDSVRAFAKGWLAWARPSCRDKASTISGPF